MTNMQTFALLSLILMAALLYYLGYHFGSKDGRSKGLAQGRKLGRDGAQIKMFNLEHQLEEAWRKYDQLVQQSRLAHANAKLGAEARETLLEIASKLQLSSATFGAINAKPHAEQALKLRDKALALAELIQPEAQERAA
jgi:hypothetical protein